MPSITLYGELFACVNFYEFFEYNPIHKDKFFHNARKKPLFVTNENKPSQKFIIVR